VLATVAMVLSGATATGASAAQGTRWHGAEPRLLGTPTLLVLPTSGQAGASYTASATNFAAAELVGVSWDGALQGSCTTDLLGACSVSLTVPPGAAGNHTVSALGGTSGLSATATFDELAPKLTATPSSGPAGSSFMASASGFQAAELIAVTFNGTPEGSCTADALGDCAVSVTVPPGPGGTYGVKAVGATSGAMASTSFVETPTLVVLPTSGQAGASYTASATDFAAAELVDVFWDGHLQGSCGTNVLGACSVALTVPAGTAGNHAVSARGGTSGLSATATFDELAPKLTATPGSGPAGSSFTASASGFEAAELIAVTFNGTPQGTCTADALGACAVSVTVPPGPGGAYGVKAVGALSGAMASTTFVVTPTLVLLPSSGLAGSPFSATATSFAAAETVGVAWDGVSQGSCTTDVLGACSVSLTVPPGAAGNHTVSALGGTSGLRATATFDELGLGPSVSMVAPASGPKGGGSTVTITGSNFEAPATVRFGTAMATNVVVASATAITAVSPAGSGTVDVTVATVLGTSATSAADRFTYLVRPTVSKVSPRSGPVTGGTTVRIVGTNFASPATVKFGAVKARKVVVVNATTIKVVCPHGTGKVAVKVTTPGGTSSVTRASHFAYHSRPTVTRVSPSTGPGRGGTKVTIKGTNFKANATVHFGSAMASHVVVVSSTTITAVSPPGAGTVRVTVTTKKGTSATSRVARFKYAAH
jgi:hypothetical protein